MIRLILAFAAFFALAVPAFSERVLVDCQNIAVNGGEIPEKRLRRDFSISDEERVIFASAESSKLELAKTLSRQNAQTKALEKKTAGAKKLSGLKKVAEFWIREREEETGALIYTYFVVYSINK